MPGRRNAGPVDNSLCRRCQVVSPVITVRNEPLCEACFRKYVFTKVVKRLETFRVRHSEPGQEPTLLIPLSFGAGSLSLLHILSEHLKTQTERTGRTGFKLHVLHVQNDIESAQSNGHQELLEKIEARFPTHAYSTIPFSGVSSLPDLPSDASEENNRLDTLLATLDSATSQTDMLQILKRKLIVSFAKKTNCEAILWGDSTTRLAERTLAETAKGRGSSLPYIVTDGTSPFGIAFYYPMRDLLSKEIVSFTSLIDPPLVHLVLQEKPRPSISMKNTTIDDLMRQYFESVEQDYPSIVANVVRTTSKLQSPALSEVEERCELCEMPLHDQAPEKSRLCYGCIRTLPSAVG
ncbi:hypothetical protein BDY17DRAFT_321088 [Neohortaea acidophila]|uniref:Cytoplasmic tRNA 2-thiolation protein 2 n=1 Tax=Neohortaea acidophila TaxID=245834 RepID=A0A6A6Q2Q5_9PEZI|nr:uncharacterized protein BDY17DRAFT_321088 [Neohortaea acidophila]KAF2486279.1 hypothetical protein BDY17DRAFT_321088 [Neohortaea acidophila]